MKLYLVQHGEAVAKALDPERPLTEEGRANSQKAASFLKAAGVRVDEIRHSARTRALQTAEIFAALLAPRGALRQTDPLDQEAPEESIRDLLERTAANVMIVDHLPALPKLAALLLTGQAEHELVQFRNAGVVCLERTDERKWRLAWALPPMLVPERESE